MCYNITGTDLIIILMFMYIIMSKMIIKYQLLMFQDNKQ